MTNARTTAVLIAVWTVLTVTVVAIEAPSSVRALFVVPFVLVAPGIAFARRYGGGDRGDVLLLAVAISVSLAIIVGGLLALLSLWHPIVGLAVLSAVALAGAASAAHVERTHQAAKGEGQPAAAA